MAIIFARTTTRWLWMTMTTTMTVFMLMAIILLLVRTMNRILRVGTIKNMRPI